MNQSLLACRMSENLRWPRIANSSPSPELEVPVLIRLAAIWDRPDDEFVPAVFNIILGRRADPSGLASCLDALHRGAPRHQLVHTIAMANEPGNHGADISWIFQLRFVSAAPEWRELCHLMTQPASEFLEGVCQLLIRRPLTHAEHTSFAIRVDTNDKRLRVLRILAEIAEGDKTRLNVAWLKHINLSPAEMMYRLVRNYWSQADREFFESVFELMFMRRPEEEAVINHLGLLKNRMTRYELVHGLAASPEYNQNRDWLPWLSRLTSHGIWAEVCRLLMTGSSEAFFDGLSELLLHSPANENDRIRFASRMQSADGRLEIVRELAASTRCKQLALDVSWLPKLDRLTSAATEAALSEVFQVSDSDFVGELYQVLLLRAPDAETHKKAKTHLAAGGSRIELVLALTKSVEFAGRLLDTRWLRRISILADDLAKLPIHETIEEYVRDGYRILLGREARPEEFRAQRQRLQLSPGTRRTFLNYLLSSPERRSYEQERLTTDR